MSDAAVVATLFLLIVIVYQLSRVIHVLWAILGGVALINDRLKENSDADLHPHP